MSACSPESQLCPGLIPQWRPQERGKFCPCARLCRWEITWSPDDPWWVNFLCGQFSVRGEQLRTDPVWSFSKAWWCCYWPWIFLKIDEKSKNSERDSKSWTTEVSAKHFLGLHLRGIWEVQQGRFPGRRVIFTAGNPHFYWVTFRGSQMGTNWVC